jgi:hypothetical protein
MAFFCILIKEASSRPYNWFGRKNGSLQCYARISFFGPIYENWFSEFLRIEVMRSQNCFDNRLGGLVPFGYPYHIDAFPLNRC